MRARLTGFAAGLALVLAPAASAQTQPSPTPTPSPTATPTPTATATPTPTPTPTPEEKQDAKDRKRKAVRRIYRDFERDGRIDDCDHTLRALKRARRSISDTYKEEFPDFRDALTAAIERHNDGDCEEQEQQLEDRNSDPTPTPSATSTPAPGGTGTTPAPPPPPTTSPTTPDSGSLPDFGSGGSGDSGDSGGQVNPLPEQPEAPGEDAIPEGTASPTPAPQATPTPTPRLIVTRAAASPDMFVPGALLAVALLGLLIAALSALFAKRSGRLAGVGHAWREAAWRTSGAWSDFSDWLRSRR
jgi:hypothetical protein